MTGPPAEKGRGGKGASRMRLCRRERGMRRAAGEGAAAEAKGDRRGRRCPTGRAGAKKRASPGKRASLFAVGNDLGILAEHARPAHDFLRIGDAHGEQHLIRAVQSELFVGVPYPFPNIA